MGSNELYSIEVALTYIDGEAVMLVQSAPTNDYDSGLEANAWINRARTGRCRAVLVTPINEAGGAHEDAEVRPEPRCPMTDCTFGPDHDLPHQDKAGEMWDELDVLGARVVIPAKRKASPA